MSGELESKIASAAKWSALGEILAKLVTPISTIVLAHVLTPQAFGVIATITMIISFAEIFMDAGFQRYVIQKEYETEGDKFQCADVAFWTNLALGLILWVVIFIFRDSLARLVGNPGLGNVLVFAAISIPVNAFTSIQMAIFKHSLDFKSLFFRRIATVVIPLCVTIPLALWLRSYWALICGTIVSNIATAVILTVFSKWRPSLYYNFEILQGMITYSSWTLLDAILVWATSYADIFFIGILLNEYYLGLYKTAITTVGQFVSLISAIILPVLMPALARSQNDIAKMRNIILKLQGYMAVLLLPMGAMIFGFRFQITDIILGHQWLVISNFIGIWAVSEVIMLLFSRFCSNIYPAIGKPRLSVIIQFLHLIVLLPAVYISAEFSFTALYWTRTLVRFQGLLLNWYFTYKLIKLSVSVTIKNVKLPLVASFILGALSVGLTELWPSDYGLLCWIPLCAAFYLGFLSIFPSQRSILISLKNQTISKYKHE